MADWPEWVSVIALAGQAVLTVLSVEQMRRRVLPSLGRLHQPGAIIDLWGPLAIVIPMMFFAGRVNPSVRGLGWVAIGGPAFCGLIAAGAAMITTSGTAVIAASAPQRRSQSLLAASLAGTALVMLLLGGAHDLTLFIGQCTFAIGALLLWINAPDEAEAQPDAAHVRAGFGMMSATLCAVGQGLCVMFVRDEYAAISGGLAVAGATMVIAWSAMLGGGQTAMRMGGWAAVYGTLLGLGVLSLVRLMPLAWQAISTRRAARLELVARGFGAYAIEAVALLLVAVMVIAPHGLAGRARQALGAIIILAAALLAAWRLAHAT